MLEWFIHYSEDLFQGIGTDKRREVGGINGGRNFASLLKKLNKQ